MNERYRSMPDASLLESWQSGDQLAGEQLLERHYRSVFRFFLRRAPERAADLAQLVFLRCVERKDRLGESGSMRAYILTAARNLWTDELRRDAARMGALDRLGVEAASVSFSAILARRYEERMLLQAIRELPEDLQLTVELYYWEECSTEEIGQILGLARGTVKWRLSDARKRMEASIRKQADSPQRLATTLDGFDRWARALRERAPAGGESNEQP